MVNGQKMSSQCLANTTKVALFYSPKSQFRLVQRPKRPCGSLKQRFLDFYKVAFWDGEDAENEFRVTNEQFKHRFLDFTQVAFWAGQ